MAGVNARDGKCMLTFRPSGRAASEARAPTMAARYRQEIVNCNNGLLYLRESCRQTQDVIRSLCVSKKCWGRL